MSDGEGSLELKPWTLLYLGGVASLAACVYVVYLVTVSGDTSLEWVFWVFFGMTIVLVGGGYYLESNYKRKHGNIRVYESFEEGSLSAALRSARTSASFPRASGRAYP